jgi:hypothetical protein
MKVNCYECKFRRNLAGDAHSCCAHPKTGLTDTNQFMNIAKLFGGRFKTAIDELEIRGNKHGIQSGWFYWPANFDPVWLENCNGFEFKDNLNEDKKGKK